MPVLHLTVWAGKTKIIVQKLCLFHRPRNDYDSRRGGEGGEGRRERRDENRWHFQKVGIQGREEMRTGEIFKQLEFNHKREQRDEEGEGGRSAENSLTIMKTLGLVGVLPGLKKTQQVLFSDHDPVDDSTIWTSKRSYGTPCEWRDIFGPKEDDFIFMSESYTPQNVLAIKLC